MIYKYTKCESVIAKIMADADMSEKNIRITDIREWIFEAVEKIGAPMQYLHKESGVDNCPILEIQDHQVPIPDDLERLTAVAYSVSPTGPWIPVRTTDATFKEPRRHHVHPEPIELQYNEHNLTIEEPPKSIEPCECDCKPPMQYKLPTSQSQFYVNNLSKYKDKALRGHWKQDITYFVKPGWIVLNRNKGFVKLSYTSIATDERGYPLVPDLPSFQEAIYWYVMMKLNFPKFLNGKLGGRVKYNYNIYTYMQHQWHFYRNQAYAEAMMPNEDQMRSIKNEWNKLIPDWESDDTFFRDNGRRQLNYNDYYYGY